MISDLLISPSILSPNSSPMKRVKDEAKEDRRLIDVTHGRKTRAIIITDSNHVILSAIQAETVSSRYEALMNQSEESPENWIGTLNKNIE